MRYIHPPTRYAQWHMLRRNTFPEGRLFRTAAPVRRAARTAASARTQHTEVAVNGGRIPASGSGAAKPIAVNKSRKANAAQFISPFSSERIPFTFKEVRSEQIK